MIVEQHRGRTVVDLLINPNTRPQNKRNKESILPIFRWLLYFPSTRGEQKRKTDMDQ